MGTREDILGRLETVYEGTDEPVAGEVPYALDLTGADRDDLLRLLKEKLEENRIGYHIVRDRDDLLDSLANRLYSGGIKSVLLDNRSVVKEMRVAEGLAERYADLRVMEAGERPEGSFECEAGLAPCEALLARTGSLVLSASTAGALAASLVPGISFCVARLDSILPDMESWIAAGGSDPQTNHVVVSGPSRTADIEKTLVMGVHGPWKVSVFLVREG